MKCINCNKDINNKKFCCHSCRATYWNKKREYKASNDTRTKKAFCMKCKKNINVNVRTNINRVMCSECKMKKPLKFCKICGSENCNKALCHSLISNSLYKKLITMGMDKCTIGTDKIFQEVARIRDVLINDYILDEKSNTVIAEQYDLNFPANVKDLLKFFDIPRRTISQGVSLAYKKGRLTPNTSHLKYKSGWHTTWNNEKVFYRSSYELNYCNMLDKQQTAYMIESLRIPYIDCNGINRIYVPDFYLKNENKIVEIKSTYTACIDSNLKLKLEAAKLMGYDVELNINGSVAQW